MIFEMRRYECWPGKMAALHDCMDKLAMPIFERLSMEIVGVWTVEIGDQDETMVYILKFNDMEERGRKWAEFFSDPQWIDGSAAIDAREGGPLTSRVVTTFLRAAPYSPVK